MSIEVFKVVFDGVPRFDKKIEEFVTEYWSAMGFMGFDLLYHIGKRTLPCKGTDGVFAFDNASDAIRFNRFISNKTSVFVSEAPSAVTMPWIGSTAMDGRHIRNFWEHRARGYLYAACARPIKGTVLCSSLRLIERINLKF